MKHPCPSHETFVALWAGEQDDADAIEAHVFACDPCARAYERVAKLVEALRGKDMPFVISHAHRERLETSGMRVLTTDIDPTPDRKPEKQARFTPDVDLLVFALRADLASADRVDVEIASPAGEPKYVLEDVPFDRAKGEVLIACQRHYETMFTAGDPIFSVHAIEAGKKRPVADYVVQHVWR